MAIDAPSGDAAYESVAVAAYVETDAFCEGCGYLLRGQPIRREPHTRIMVTRCPECGAFVAANDLASAARMWLRRLSTILVMAWMIVLVGAGLIEMLMQFLVVTELDRQVVYHDANPASNPGMDLAEGIIVGLIVGGLSFFMMLAAAASFPHWRSSRQLILGLLRTGLITLLAALSLSNEFSPWRTCMTLILAGFVLIHGGAGLLAAFAGRRFLRLLASILLPARLRPAVGYLWTADGLEPPCVSEKRPMANQ